MRQINSEVLTVASGSTFTLTRATIDNGPGPRVTRAVITNHDLGDSGVGFRIGEDDPVEGSYTFHPLPAGESMEIDGYDNLIALKFILTGTVTAKVFVEYYV
jgi:hypothetical protein